MRTVKLIKSFLGDFHQILQELTLNQLVPVAELGNICGILIAYDSALH
jgi:hypothetical protein